MENIFKDYLFSKHILVSEKGQDPNAFETLFSIANLFNIRIKEGQKLAERGMIEYISSKIGMEVPDPFYKGFPDSVRKLSSDELLFDQLVHYAVTYGFGNFSEAGHSLLEERVERIAFNEKAEIKEFIILSEADALLRLKESVNDLFLGTRPLSQQQFDMVCEYVKAYRFFPEKCASKNLAIRLLNSTRGLYFANFLNISDVLKLVEEINYREYKKTDIHKLNLRNRDRKFISTVLDYMFHKGKAKIDTINCFERKAEWSGLLHHIHYKTGDSKESYDVYLLKKDFLGKMRGSENNSVYSAFEKSMDDGKISEAIDILKSGKGSGALLRNLDYIMSRCKTEDEIRSVLENLTSANVMIMIQLLIKYSSKSIEKNRRTFSFTKYEKMKVHLETAKEASKRKTILSNDQTEILRVHIKKQLEQRLKNRLGKVYIDDSMKTMALPVQETAASSGLGVLAKGSRLHIDDCKKIRAFTYWEKVDDIDLSCFGITDEGKRIEFSWRTMAGKQSEAITYSGDQTSGYNGGSEFFDIVLDEFKSTYPEVKYIIFCDNVFSSLNFCDCFCKAGYMLRDIEDSGQVFEPKTVASSFTVNADSRFAYLFGIDLDKNDFIWLNIKRDSSENVAGETPLEFLVNYFFTTDVINVKSFFEMMASEIVTDPQMADVVVSDTVNASEINEGCKLIHSYDFEKMTALMG